MMITVGLIGLFILLIYCVGLGLQAFGFALLWFRRRHRVQEYLALPEHLAGHAVEALRRCDPIMPDSAGYAMLYEALADVYRKERRESLPAPGDIKFIENRGTSIAGRPVVHVVWNGGESPVEIDDLDWAVQLRLHANRGLRAAKFFLYGLGVTAVGLVMLLVLLVLALAAR